MNATPNHSATVLARMTIDIISIREYAIADPDSFYTQRWECGFMVYHGRFNWFSLSISEAKAKLVEIRAIVGWRFLLSEKQKIVHGDCLRHERQYTKRKIISISETSQCSRLEEPVCIEQIYPLNPSAYEYARRKAKNLRFEGHKVLFLKFDIDPHFAELIADMAIAQRNAMYLPKEALRNDN
jgi:hypothetical protein